MLTLDTSPFLLGSGSIGCLLIHGFTGSPPEMRQLGEYLAEKGIKVSGVLLAGHGTSPQDMIKTRWQDWTLSAEDALNELRRTCKEIFIAGLSMGGSITLYLAAKNFANVKGAISLSAAAFIKDWRLMFLPFLTPFIKYFPAGEDSDLTNPAAINDICSYPYTPLPCVRSLLNFTKEVRTILPKIKIPMLVMHGMCDKTLSPKNAKYIYDNISSKEKEIIFLNNSGHGITVDSEKHTVFEAVYNFIEKHRSN